MKAIEKADKQIEKYKKLRKKINNVQKKIESIPVLGNTSFVKHPMATSLGVFGKPGRMAGKAIGTILGTGDYKVKFNSIATGPDMIGHDAVPRFANTKTGVRVQHREYIGDVVSGAAFPAFSNQLYRVNPGNIVTFPWLSTIAQNFEQWEPHGIVFTFKSTSSDYAGGSSQALGTIIMASEYDLNDPAYTTKLEMENTEFACSAKTSASLMHPIECAPTERQVRVLKVSSTTSTVDNQQWYDLCSFQIATQGLTANSVNIGELWVTYDISFYKESITGGLTGTNILAYSGDATSGIANATPFGTMTATSSSNLNLTVGTATLTFPSYIVTGTYLISYLVTGTSATVTTAAPAYTTNCSVGPAIWNGSASYLMTALATTTIGRIFTTVTITGPSAVLTFSSGQTLPTSASAANLYVSQISPNVY